jgi:4-amino-4-deoxy-L-arabinose transferase-like glycosyltransferase
MVKVYRLAGLIERHTFCATLLFTAMALAWYAQALPQRWPDAKGYEYEWIAVPLSEGHGFSFERWARWLGPYNDGSDYGSTAWVEPLQTIIMAGCFRVFGESGRLLLVLLNFVWLGATCVVVYHLVRRIDGPEAALATSILLALFPANRLLLFYIGNSALTGLLVSSCALALIHYMDHASVRCGLVLGVVLGFTCLTHAGALFLVPFSAIMIVITLGVRSMRAWMSATMVLMVATLVISPWTFRNWITFGKFVPVRTGQGHNLHYAIPALAQTFTPGLRPDRQWKDPPWTARNVFEAVSILRHLESQRKIRWYSIHTVEANRPDGYDQFNEAQRDAVFLSQTIDFAFAHPLLVLKMMIAKSLAFFFTNWPPLGVVTAIALFGALVRINDRRANAVTIFILLLALPYTLSAPLFYRYRYPIESLIFVLVGLFLGVLIKLGRGLSMRMLEAAV